MFIYCIYKIIIICILLSRLILYCVYCYFNDKFYIHFSGSLEYWINEWMNVTKLCKRRMNTGFILYQVLPWLISKMSCNLPLVCWEMPIKVNVYVCSCMHCSWMFTWCFFCDTYFSFQLKDAGMLHSYSFSHSDLSAILETHRKEEFLSRLISFLEYLKVSSPSFAHAMLLHYTPWPFLCVCVCVCVCSCVRWFK